MTGARTYLFAVIVLLPSCGGSPAQPSSNASVIVSGLDRYATPLVPALKIQLAAALQYSTGSQQDCTASAQWASSNEASLRYTGQPGQFMTIAAGDAAVSAICSGATGRLAVRVDNAPTWTVSGRVIAAPNGPPITGASLTFGSSASVQSDTAGGYTIVTNDASTRALVVSASGFQTRETWLRAGESRLVDIDLIGSDPTFPFNLYRMLVRNAYESPAEVATVPARPWTQAPNVYIWTTWKDTGQPVGHIDWYVAEIRRVMPQLTGGRYAVDRIEVGPGERPPASGWINVQFDHSGNWVYIGADPGQVQIGSDSTCNSPIVIHEFGHAMGYWHSNLMPSVMGGGAEACKETNLWPSEQIVARTMYSRPRGNLDPDRDPAGTGVLLGRGTASAPVRITCDRVLDR